MMRGAHRMGGNSFFDCIGFSGGSDLVYLLFLLLVAVLIFQIIKNIKPSSINFKGSSDESLSILNRRLASGEITLEEYERIKATIQEKR